MDFKHVGTQSVLGCVWFVFSPEDNAIFIFAPFFSCGIWFLTCLSVWKSLPFLLFRSFSSFLHFFFSNAQSCCEVSLRSWKVLFKPKVFAVFTFQLARWISVGQSVERKGFWQDFWRPTSSSCLSLLQFSHNWLSRTAAEKTQNQMQTEKSQSFKIHQWGPCGDAALLRFFTSFEKWEIGAFSLVISEWLTVSSCSVRAGRQCNEYMTWSKTECWGATWIYMSALLSETTILLSWNHRSSAYFKWNRPFPHS